MNSRFCLQWSLIIFTFLVALVLEVMPWPVNFQGFRPAWIVLVLLYWTLAIPNKVNVGWAWIVGVVWDLLLGSVLGTHALILVIFSYLVSVNYLILRNLSLWLQSVLAMLFVFAIRFALFLVELFLHSARFNLDEIIGAIISGILWTWVFLLLRHLRRKVKLH